MPQNPVARASLERTVTDLNDRLAAVERLTNIRSLNLIVDGHGFPITTGIKGDVRLDFFATVLAWKLVADQVGDVVLDVWKASFAAFPPTVPDSIVGAVQPELVGQLKASDDVLTGWTTGFERGDYLRLNVDSVDGTLTRVVLTFMLAAS